MDNRKLYYLFGTVALVLFLFFLFTRKKAETFSWQETYLESDKDPYGSYLLRKLMPTYFPDNTFKVIDTKVADQLPAITSKPTSYILLGEAMYFDSIDVAQLLQFVENGNSVFFASKTMPYDLMFHIYYEECNGQFWEDYSHVEDSTVRMNFYHPNLVREQGFDYSYIYRHQAELYRWHFIDSMYFCQNENGLQPLGYIDSLGVNFARAKYGVGYFYLHTNPVVFSNLQLLEEIGVDYVNQVFAHLPKGTVYWDEVSRVDEAIGRRRNDLLANNPNRGLSADSPLQYVLAQPSLAWAWYLGLALALTYLLFHAKRKQRIIPVLEAKRNSSMEFLATVGSLYFIQQDHRKLAMQKTRLFLVFIRDRYNLSTADLDEQFVARLASRAEVPVSLLNTILEQRKFIKAASSITEKALIRYHVLIDQFYKTCK